MIRVNNKLWIIADTHFAHGNIIKFQQRPKNHEFIMVGNWASRVGERDQILHLGDVSMGGTEVRQRWLNIIKRLPGEKYLLMGNHDKAKDDFAGAGFTVLEEFVTKGIAFSHRPATEDRYDEEGNDWVVNIHGHTHANVYDPAHDGILLKDRKYINVCVEHTNLSPVQLGQVYPL